MIVLMKAIGYARVSSDKQAEHGCSLEAQTSKIRAMAQVQGAELVDIIVDGGESAKSLDRPGEQRILELVRERKVDAVIVTKLDRLTRSVRDLADLLELFSRRGVALVSVAESLDTATASGRLVINLLISVSQWEREATGERTRFAMQYKKSERVGTISYGFQLSADNKHLEPYPAEQAVINVIRRLRKAGRTLRAIAVELNKRKLTTRSGSAWHHVYVTGVLKASGLQKMTNHAPIVAFLFSAAATARASRGTRRSRFGTGVSHRSEIEFSDFLAGHV